MVSKPMLLLCALLGVAFATTATQQRVEAKKLVKKAKVAYAANKNYFVPPPPPYVPTLLPSRYGQYYYGATSSKIQKENTTSETPYSKYIYTRTGSKAPIGVQQNKYVTTWSYKT